ncbi:MAG: DUF1003 domain-containing protein [Acidobacteriaceae bacterium]|nr:DUF1003 domain-containing protein [Acidobacteriaceae bacterium]
MKHNSPSPQAIQENIDAISKLEQQFLEKRSLAERGADAIADFAGSISFVAFHIVIFALWFIVNANAIPLLRPFDPYPFVFLSMVVSVEGVLLATFVLMKQNRMTRRADQRAQLDLQINLLAEREATKNLQILKRLCDHLGLEKEASDAEIEELSQNTAIESLADDLRRKLPDQ